MTDKNQNDLTAKIVSLCKRRGFVYPTSEIYGGLSNSYDYGPMGAELLRNIRNSWWKEFITNRDDMVGLDTQIILHPETWIASGHVGGFSDPLVEDLVTHKRYRADHLIEQWLEKNPNDKATVEDLTVDLMNDFIKQHKILSPDNNPLSEVKSFNLLFETSIGAVSGSKSTAYLRGETAQGIFTNFKQVINSTRVKLPFGIGNIGKSFRNEITTGQFVFRTLEFEQAEIEYFFDPETTQWQEVFKGFQDAMFNFVTKTLGVNQENLRWRQHSDKERSFYSQETYDLEYKFPFGWKELWGIAYRTDYDLKQQMEHSGQSLEYVDSATGKKMLPHVIEPAVGINRLFYMVLADRYYEDEKRAILKLSPQISPYKLAVFPLVSNKPELSDKARQIYTSLKSKFTINWDDRGNIGKRYLAQDEIGTPYCLVVDYQTLEDNTVSIRDRDTMTQIRIKADEVDNWLSDKLNS